MGLTLQQEQKLEDAKLIEFFDSDRGRWLALAKQAYDFVAQTYPDSSRIRQDDVARALLPTVEVELTLKDYLDENRLTPKYWRQYFCSYILDFYWPQLDRQAGRTGT